MPTLGALLAANPEIERYIYDAAVKRGIDPNVALKVARAEALNVFDPTKPDLGGDDRSSFGPFQLHYAGRSKKMPNAGLGDEFTKQTGLRADDPSTWKQQVDFSLDWAKKKGWGDWMGAAAAGVGERQGIGGAEGPRGGPVEAAGGGAGNEAAGAQIPSMYDFTPVAAKTIEKIAVTPVTETTKTTDPYVDTSNPWSNLASGMASSVARGNTGLEQPDMAALPAPTADFASAAPPESMAPVSTDTAPSLSPLADLFKVATIGVDPRLSVDQFGRSTIKRQYG